MAASPQSNDNENGLKKEMEKHVEEVNGTNTKEEYEGKVSKLGFTMSNWVKVLFNTHEEEFHAEWKTNEQYIGLARDILVDTWKITNTPDWTLEKRGPCKGDVVESKKTEKYGKAFMVTGLVECHPKFLYKEFKDNFANLPKWNPTILKTETIKSIAPGIELAYQVTAPGGGGMVASRDFTIIRQTTPLSKDGAVMDENENPYNYISCGSSVSIPGYPPNKNYVRGLNRAGCWLLTPQEETSDGKTETYTKFQWLMCCDLKGKIPQFVVDTAFATVMLDYLAHVRKFVADSKSKDLL